MNSLLISKTHVSKSKSFQKMIILTLCFFIIFLVSACNNDKIEINSEVNSEVFIESTVSIPKSSLDEKITKLGIINNYFTPIEENSWERRYDAELIMLHFCSAIGIDFEHPYDINKVRKMLIDYGASIHYLIDRNGKIYCYVPQNRVAWHAGNGTFNNDEKYVNSMNQYAIGIELLAIGSQSDMSQYLTSEEYNKIDNSLIGFTDSQYTALNDLLDYICEKNDITKDKKHIIGHEEYNPLKTDPGDLFDWSRILK